MLIPPSSARTCADASGAAAARHLVRTDQDYGAKQTSFVPLFSIPAATVTATIGEVFACLWPGAGVAAHPEPLWPMAAVIA